MIDGWLGGALKVKIRAPALDGRANDAVCAFLADMLGVPRRAVTLLRGEKSRQKVVRLTRLDRPRSKPASGVCNIMHYKTQGAAAELCNTVYYKRAAAVSRWNRPPSSTAAQASPPARPAHTPTGPSGDLNASR